ncbi:MAG TPA: hypothetical protein VFD73_24380 [Gemmatimonadales bacterium]|nr:hypothetical protein [Gemmatimonadales bacterium]
MATELLVIARPAVAQRRREPFVAGRFRGIHRHWLEETRDWLAPAIAPDASFVRGVLAMFGPSDGFALATATTRVERGRRTLAQSGVARGW